MPRSVSLKDESTRCRQDAGVIPPFTGRLLPDRLAAKRIPGAEKGLAGENSGLAVFDFRDIDQPGLRIVGHRIPVVSAHRRGVQVVLTVVLVLVIARAR